MFCALAEQHRPALTAQSTQAVRSELSRAWVVCFFFLKCVYISKASFAQMASGRHTTCKQNIQHGGGWREEREKNVSSRHLVRFPLM